jgi:hypothetical protein
MAVPEEFDLTSAATAPLCEVPDGQIVVVLAAFRTANDL